MGAAAAPGPGPLARPWKALVPRSPSSWKKAARAAMEHGLRRVEVQVKGPGSGRDTAVRSIQSTGIEVTSIKDVTPVPHNGCRQPKRRRT